MAGAPGLGWWQASDGEWYPPELHPNHRRDAPQLHHVSRGHLLEQARTVEPTRRRPGAGDYTVKHVTLRAHRIRLALTTVAILIGSVAVVLGALLALSHLS